MEKKRKLGLFGFLDLLANCAGLNLLFLLCSIPLITFGASLTSLYAGMRALAKREPCFIAFFKTFRKSFLRATVLWLILLPVNAATIFGTYSIWYYQPEGYLPKLILSLLFSVVFLAITTMVFLFYSRFEGTVVQLLRFGGTMFLSHPIRGLVITLGLWLPALILVFFPMTFLFFGMVWLFLYFAGIAFVSVWLINFPFIRFARDVLGMDVSSVSPPDEEKANP